MLKIKRLIYPIVNDVIRILLLLITAGMYLQSLFSTSFIGEVTSEDGFQQERTLNIADQPWKHLLLFVVFTAAGVLLYRGIPDLRASLGRVFCGRRIMVTKPGAGQNRPAWGKETAEGGETGSVWRYAAGTIVILVMGTVWILVTRLYPGSDPAKVYAIAMQWRRGDFSAYAEGGYLFRYPFQAGIILFYYLLSFIFGIDNYIGLQFANVIALAAVYGLLVKLSEIFWPTEKKLPSMVYASLILWVPLSFYVTYLYGILPGMALSLGALYFAAKYLTTRRYRYMLPAALCMGLATVIKMNCLVYLIAIGCFLIYDALDIVLLKKKEQGKKWIASLACLAVMGLGVAGCNSLCSRYVEHLSGYEAGQGLAMVSWVVMGLQETPLGPGGYSGYINEIFERYEYDTEKAAEASIADIKKALTRLSHNPLDEGLPFFARKNAFQWNDPTFISLDRTKGRKTNGSMPAYARSLIEGRGSVTLSVLLNYAQTLLLAGFILYLILNRKSRNLYELMGAVVFLGGYLFHFFWESSASYTIPYFVILVPYAVKGLADWIRGMDRQIGYLGDVIRQGGTSGHAGGENNAEQAGAGEKAANVHAVFADMKKVWLPAGGLLAVVCVTVLFSRTNLFDRTIALNDGADAAWQFYHRGEDTAAKDSVAAGIPAGYYYLSPYLAQDTALTVRDGEMTFVPVEAVTGRIEVYAEGIDPSGAAGRNDAIQKLSQVSDIDNKVLLQKESGGVYIRFRSNEQVLAADCGGENAELVTYLDDSMNIFHVPREDVFYYCELCLAEEAGYYITIDGLALTYRKGKAALAEPVESDEQRWILQW